MEDWKHHDLFKCKHISLKIENPHYMTFISRLRKLNGKYGLSTNINMIVHFCINSVNIMWALIPLSATIWYVYGLNHIKVSCYSTAEPHHRGLLYMILSFICKEIIGFTETAFSLKFPQFHFLHTADSILTIRTLRFST